MALVVFLRGVNVGGHRKMRPTVLAQALRRLDVVTIGAAGTFVVRKAVARAELRAAIAGQMPFEVELAICSGGEVLRLVAGDPFAGHAAGRDVVPFVGVMARKPSSLSLPSQLPTEGEWGLKILRREGPFVLGLYRRQMKALAHLGQLEKACGVPLTIRNWNTILAVERVLRA